MTESRRIKIRERGAGVKGKIKVGLSRGSFDCNNPVSVKFSRQPVANLHRARVAIQQRALAADIAEKLFSTTDGISCIQLT